MASIPTNISRVSNQLKSDVMLSNLRNTNVELLKVQQQISTGYRVNRPSDDPGAVGNIVSLRTTLNQYDKQVANLSQGKGFLDNTDQAMSDVLSMLLESQSIASNQIGVGSNTETRKNQASVISAQINGLIDIVNREYNNVFLFAGDASSVRPFESMLGGVQYQGGSKPLQTDLGALSELGVNVSGAQALGAMSSRISSTVDLDPQATAETRLIDLNGARQLGITRGTVEIEVDGISAMVDLATADTMGDVMTRINEAINIIDPTAGGLSLSTNGFNLTANGGHDIEVRDVGTGVTAQDLGVNIAASSAIVAGGDVDPKLTELTELSALGVAVDWLSGLKITNGSNSAVIDFSSASNIQDLMVAVKNANIGAKMQISADGTGLDLFNTVSGISMSVGENSGGSTASDLGLRTFDTTTLLSDLNYGKGVHVVQGEADFRLNLHDGSAIDVNIDGASTVIEVINAINAAAGGSANATLASDGNGIVLTDNTVGASAFNVIAINNSFAANDLGIRTGAGAGSTINGEDVAQVRVESVLTHMMMLRDALLNDDSAAITVAGSLIEKDQERMAGVRAEVGVRSQRVTELTNRTEDLSLSARRLLSDIRDTDFTEAITRFEQLQLQLQANLQSGQMIMQLSLLDFLR